MFHQIRVEVRDALRKLDDQKLAGVRNMFEQNPGREFCEVGTAYKAGVLARVHDNSSILKDVVKIDTEIDKNDHKSQCTRFLFTAPRSLSRKLSNAPV